LWIRDKVFHHEEHEEHEGRREDFMWFISANVEDESGLDIERI
tara:strand:- start:889 stop:1017 length:129 start_codon:yes stop_codon:yes gene_type:complete